MTWVLESIDAECWTNCDLVKFMYLPTNGMNMPLGWLLLLITFPKALLLAVRFKVMVLPMYKEITSSIIERQTQTCKVLALKTKFVVLRLAYLNIVSIDAHKAVNFCINNVTYIKSKISFSLLCHYNQYQIIYLKHVGGDEDALFRRSWRAISYKLYSAC